MWQIYAAGAALTAIVTFRMVECVGIQRRGHHIMSRGDAHQQLPSGFRR